MNPTETIAILQDGASEIRRLRRENEILSAKVEVMNLFATVLHTQPAYNLQGASVDVAWQMDKLSLQIKDELPTHTK